MRCESHIPWDRAWLYRGSDKWGCFGKNRAESRHNLADRFSEIEFPDGTYPLYLKYCGAGEIDLKEISFAKEYYDEQ